ncbi:MAG TPA: DUF4097 family beta strand repeat-containing protein [Bacteroidota bacterium]|nr:DUF4097 family beta strand repeat-containing protein [Bacteroidota bacterium]
MTKRFAFLLIGLLFTAFMVASSHDDGEGTTSKTFDVSPGGTLDISVDGGDIHITPVEKNRVTVRAIGIDEDEADDLHMTTEGTTVRIEKYSGDWDNNTRYDIDVPSKFNLRMRTRDGNITVDGTITGEVSCQTSSGDIRLSVVNGKVDATTSGGNITTRDVQGDLDVRTSGGDIMLGSIGGSADISTSGGNIRMDNVKKTLMAKTSGGDVIVGDVGGEATISTSGGNITVGRVSASVRMSTAGGDVELEGASGDVRAKTAGGNMRLLGITGTIDARTAGGDIDAELMPSGKGESRISTASGQIRLDIPENAKATIHAEIRIDGYWRELHDEYRVRSDFASQSYDVDKNDREIRATYVLNGGGDVITLETSNADIIISKMAKHSEK